MLTVDFDRLGVGPGDRVLDLGCGAAARVRGYRRGADVVAFDQRRRGARDVEAILRRCRSRRGARAARAPRRSRATRSTLPFPDATFDCVIASEVLEHIPDDDAAIAEMVRVLKPGGRLAVTVPRWLPEKVCWALSDEYHANEGGHIRIYRADELRAKIAGARPGVRHSHHAHALHSPYWWLKCAVGVDKRQPAGQRLPQAAGVGHHEAAVADPVRRGGCSTR